MKILLVIIFIAVMRAQAEIGIASWYEPKYPWPLMANGHPFDPNALTCASWFYPFGTRLRVSTATASVVVVVTDRGPAMEYVLRGRAIDLSRLAFSRLASPTLGLITVKIQKLNE